MNAENDFLASAYVDGELTDDERRIAEADPAVMAEVADLRALRSQIADVAPAGETARESAIAAAMGVFHEQYDRAAERSPAVVRRPSGPSVRDRADTVLSFWRRPIATQLLGAAAAVLILGVLGVVIASGLRSTGDDDDSAADIAADEPASEALTTALDAQRDDVASAEIAADEPADEPAEEAAAVEVAAAEAIESVEASDDADLGEVADEAELEAPAQEPADEPASDGAATIDGSLFFGAQPSAIVTPDDLTAAGAYLAAVEDTDPLLLTPTPNTSCGPALDDATLLVDGVATDVVIVVDRIAAQVIAYDDDCSVVMIADLSP
jgi:hypothetical protein